MARCARVDCELRVDEVFNVHVARPATTAFGKEHEWQCLRLGKGEHSIEFEVVEDALCTREHRRVISHNHRLAHCRAHKARVDAADACDHAVRRRELLQLG